MGQDDPEDSGFNDRGIYYVEIGQEIESSSSAVTVVGLSAASAVNEPGGGGGAGVVSFLFSWGFAFHFLTDL